MSEEKIPNARSSRITHKPNSWWHDETYLAKHKFSMLAAIEALFATWIFYAILIPNTPWPWFSLVSFLSVPLLLLRSERSIQRGVELLKQDWVKRKLGSKEVWIIGIGGGIVFLGIFTLEYFFIFEQTKHYNFAHTLLGRMSIFTVLSVVLITTAVMIVVAIVGAGAVTKAKTRSKAESRLIKSKFTRKKYLDKLLFDSKLLKITTSVQQVDSVKMETAAWKNAIPTLKRAVLNEIFAFFRDITGAGSVVVTRLGLGAIFLAPGYLIGLCIRSVYIRLRATCNLTSLRDGVANFSRNLYETVLVSNIRHPPALLPRAGEVSPFLSVLTLPITKGIVSNTVRIAFVFAFTVAATLYRWNIKANAWIWLLPAIVLNPIKWKTHPDIPAGLPPDERRTNAASWSSAGVQTLIATLLTIFVSYLLFPHIPTESHEKLSNWTPLLVRYSPPNVYGLRYWLVAVLTIALAWQFFCASAVRKYPKILEEHTTHQQLPSNPDPTIEMHFDAAVKRLVRARFFTFASFLLFVYAFAIKYALDKWPNELQNVVWDWLKALL